MVDDLTARELGDVLGAIGGCIPGRERGLGDGDVLMLDWGATDVDENYLCFRAVSATREDLRAQVEQFVELGVAGSDDDDVWHCWLIVLWQSFSPTDDWNLSIVSCLVIAPAVVKAAPTSYRSSSSLSSVKRRSTMHPQCGESCSSFAAGTSSALRQFAIGSKRMLEKDMRRLGFTTDRNIIQSKPI